MVKKALISGITGQDGSFLAEFLLAKGYQVHGIVRRASTFNTERLDSIYADPHEQSARLYLSYGDLTDGSGLRHAIEKVQPQEIYNLAAQSHVRVSFDQPEYTADVVATGQSHSVRDFLDVAAGRCGLDWKSVAEADPRYLRPTEVDYLMGDSSKIRKKLGWEPKVSFEELVRMMVDHDLELAGQEQTLAKAGHKVVVRGSSHG